MSTFTGFPEDLIYFLRDLSKNNNRNWFAENKRRYQSSVVEPVKSFIITMGERLPEISMNFVADPRSNGGSMFRIYRDVRFSKDKRPFKENVGCQFRHIAGKTAHAPGYYVHIEPDAMFAGGGIWMPPNPILHQIRTAIVEHPDAWSNVLKSAESFGGILGDRLKRVPRDFDPDSPHTEDLKLKSIFIKRDFSTDRISSPEILDTIFDTFAESAPLLRFITQALGLPF